MSKIVALLIHLMVLIGSASIISSSVKSYDMVWTIPLALIPAVISIILLLSFHKWNQSRFGWGTFSVMESFFVFSGIFLIDRLWGDDSNTFACFGIILSAVVIPSLIFRFAFKGFYPVELRGCEVVDETSMASCCLMRGHRVWVTSPKHPPMKHHDPRIESVVNTIPDSEDPLLLIVMGTTHDDPSGVSYMHARHSRRTWIEFSDQKSAEWWIRDNGAFFDDEDE